LFLLSLIQILRICWGNLSVSFRYYVFMEWNTTYWYIWGNTAAERARFEYCNIVISGNEHQVWPAAKLIWCDLSSLITSDVDKTEKNFFIFKMCNVFKIVPKVVIFVRSKENNCHKFKDFLADIEYEY
jgi:hypothetical protein